ncbi:MAG TPA: TolC family protein [Cyclobacteriaceae bacterium]|jgi:outer membrane protein TolC|nr:TolC family protein [Cyclobacteriaceae bacterium]
MTHSLNQNLRKYLIAILLMMSVGFVSAQISIESCQEKAKANYPLIKQYDLISKSVEYNISNANKAYLPQISVTGIGAYIFKGLPQTTLPGVPPKEPDKFQLIGIGQLNQTIWDGGATRSQKEIAKANGEVERANIDVALHSIKERVNQIYFGILLIDEQVNQLVILQGTINRNLNAVTLSKDNGLAYQTDVDELKAESMKLDQRKIEFRYTRKGYIEMLSYLTGQQLNEEAQLQKPVVLDSVYSHSNNRPELNLYANQRKLSIAQASINRVYNMPKIGVLGAGVLIEPGIGFGTSTLNSIAIGGVSVAWNTSGIYKTSNNRQLDKIRMDRISNQEETFLFGTNLQLKQTQSDIEKQKAVLAKDHEIVELKEKIRNGYQKKYENGMSSMNDVIQAINKESEAKSQEAMHQVQLLMSLYQYQTINGN